MSTVNRPTAERLSFGLIGFGHWGRILGRTIDQHPSCRLKVVSDPSEAARSAVCEIHPGTAAIANPELLFADKEISVVAIASPASSHFPLAMQAMMAGKHVVVTKPVSETFEQSRLLQVTSHELRRVVVVDHTFLYHPCVTKLKQILCEGWFGSPLVFDSIRQGLGIYKADADVIADLSVHDLAILEYLFGMPEWVSTQSHSAISGCLADNALITLSFETGLRAHLRSSWLSPVKERRVILVGSRQMILWDDALGLQRLRAFNVGIERLESAQADGRAPIGYRHDGVRAISTSDVEPLSLEIDDLVDCITNGGLPVSSLDRASRVTAIMSACHLSASQCGVKVSL